MSVRRRLMRHRSAVDVRLLRVSKMLLADERQVLSQKPEYF